MSFIYNQSLIRIMEDNTYAPHVTWEFRKLTIRERLSVLFGATDPRVQFEWPEIRFMLVSQEDTDG